MLAPMRTISRVALASLAVWLLITLVGAWPARAATITVNTLVDDSGVSAPACASGVGLCTLRGALVAANNGDTVAFSVSGTIPLTNGTLVIAKNLTIQGGAVIAVDGQSAV